MSSTPPPIASSPSGRAFKVCARCCRSVEPGGICERKCSTCFRIPPAPAALKRVIERSEEPSAPAAASASSTRAMVCAFRAPSPAETTSHHLSGDSSDSGGGAGPPVPSVLKEASSYGSPA
eukprot:scaffold213971_cov31-Tisochrysis_lutea.AAC.3